MLMSMSVLTIERHTSLCVHVCVCQKVELYSATRWNSCHQEHKRCSVFLV